MHIVCYSWCKITEAVVFIVGLGYKEDGECTTEFRLGLLRGQAIGASLQKIWKSHSIPISTKMRLMKAQLWPVATYGKNEETHLDAFEMKGLRKILRVSWTAKKRFYIGS